MKEAQAQTDIVSREAPELFRIDVRYIKFHTLNVQYTLNEFRLFYSIFIYVEASYIGAQISKMKRKEAFVTSDVEYVFPRRLEHVNYWPQSLKFDQILAVRYLVTRPGFATVWKDVVMVPRLLLMENLDSLSDFVRFHNRIQIWLAIVGGDI